jgi:hypothetical protein
MLLVIMGFSVFLSLCGATYESYLDRRFILSNHRDAQNLADVIQGDPMLTTGKGLLDGRKIKNLSLDCPSGNHCRRFFERYGEYNFQVEVRFSGGNFFLHMEELPPHHLVVSLPVTIHFSVMREEAGKMLVRVWR